MSERKVLNKYIPPTFDPEKIRRQRPKKNGKANPIKHQVRLMTPFSMRCSACGEYIYRGRKFNALKEVVQGETYLGIKIFRFYIKCPRCSGEITYKTDPEHTDYIAEDGAVRNFNPRQDEDALALIESEKRKTEESVDAMKAIENKTRESRKQLEDLDELDALRDRSARHAQLETLQSASLQTTANGTAQQLHSQQKELEDEEDAQAARQAFQVARKRKLASAQRKLQGQAAFGVPRKT